MIKTHYYRFSDQISFRLVLPLILCFVPTALSQAQELNTADMSQPPEPPSELASDDIQANGVNEAIKPMQSEDDTEKAAFDAGPCDVYLSAEASLVYNDNIYIQKSDRKADLVFTLAPHFAIGAGDWLKKEESWLAIDYSPSFIAFLNHDGNDAVDEDASLNFEWRPGNWTFGLKQRYQELSGPVIEIGNRVERSVYNSGLYIKYDLSPKTNLELDADQSINDYAHSLYSFNLRTVAGWLDYWITPRIKLGVGPTLGALEVRQNPDQTYLQGLLRAEYEVSEGATIRGSIGGEAREFQDKRGTRSNGIFSFGGNYQIGENTTLQLDTYRNDESSLIAADENYTVTGGSVGASQVVADNYTFSFAGGFDHSVYYATARDVNPNSPYNYFYLRSGIDWRVSSQIVVGLFYQYQDNLSSGSDAFRNNLTGLTLGYHF